MTASTMLRLGTAAPEFRLRDAAGQYVSLADFNDASGVLVIFMCNHCPYVKHIRHELADLSEDTHSPTSMTKRKPWPRPTGLPARRTSFSSTGIGGLFIAVSSTTAGRATAFPPPERICARPWMRCCQAGRSLRRSNRASGATLNGSPATNRTILEGRHPGPTATAPFPSPGTLDRRHKVNAKDVPRH